MQSYSHATKAINVLCICYIIIYRVLYFVLCCLFFVRWQWQFSTKWLTKDIACLWNISNKQQPDTITLNMYNAVTNVRIFQWSCIGSMQPSQSICPKLLINFKAFRRRIGCRRHTRWSGSKCKSHNRIPFATAHQISTKVAVSSTQR